MGVLINVKEIINNETLDVLLKGYKDGIINIKTLIKLYCKTKIEPNVLHDFGTRGRYKI